MTKQHRDDPDLLWYFYEGERAFRYVSFGALLEKADVFSHDSNGERIPVLPANDWSVMHVQVTASEPSYTIDDEDLVRVAHVSRRLRYLRPPNAMILRVYYGDIGARWSKTRAGRLFSLYALTDAGQSWLAKERPENMRADERIGGFAKGPPTPERTAALLAMHTQAKTLLAKASDAWEVTLDRCA